MEQLSEMESDIRWLFKKTHNQPPFLNHFPITEFPNVYN
jgi:hypothetical protein